VKYKSTEQAHLSVAVPAIPLNHPDRHAIQFLSVVLGEGMSSRLFIELREKRGLVYDVHSYAAHFLDTGAFNVYTGVDPKNAVAALIVVLAELGRLREDGPTTEELTKARELSKGRLMLRMETPATSAAGSAARSCSWAASAASKKRSPRWTPSPRRPPARRPRDHRPVQASPRRRRPYAPTRKFAALLPN